MKILALDTSGEQASVAIVDEYITIGEISINAKRGEKSWTHSEILTPCIDQLFSLSGLSPQNIDYIAYTCGPGAFTGLRIGAATAIGLAKALNIPAIPVPTLDALAYNVAEPAIECHIVPMMDARQGQVYFAVYNQSFERKTDYLALPIKEALDEAITAEMTGIETMWGTIIFVGCGADLYKENINALMGSNQVEVYQNLNRVRASSVAVLAMKHVKSGQFTPPTSNEVEILYVRPPQAIREKEKAKVNEIPVFVGEAPLCVPPPTPIEKGGDS